MIMTNTSELMLKHAIEHQQAGRFQAAERCYLEILQLHPSHPDANHNLGDLAVQMMQPEVGLPYFLAALEADPERAKFWTSYIDALFQAGYTDDARQVFGLARQQGLEGGEVDALSSRLNADRAAESLAKWIEAYAKSAEYVSLTREFEAREGKMIGPEEAAMIYGLILHLKPKLSLEIGTFFAGTTQLMAQALSVCGSDSRMITVDPFGADRVPGIIKTWPAQLQEHVDFFPWNSMQLFVSLDVEGMPKGYNSPFGLIFVDGNHDFEYALFDIIRSADHLKPNSAIVIDNLEQAGVRAALVQFMRYNPAWQFLYKGIIWTSAIRIEDIEQECDEPLWGVLISPDGVGVSSVSTKLVKRALIYQPLKALRLNTLQMPKPGQITVEVFYLAVPHDFSVSGEGMITVRIKKKLDVDVPNCPIRIEFSKNIEFESDYSRMDISCEVTLSYTSTHDDAFLLLDAKEPFSLIPDSGWSSFLS